MKTDVKAESGKLAGKAKGVVHLALLLDESGSMTGNEEAVIGGVNQFLADFRTSAADIRVWLATFDHHPGEKRTRVKLDGKRVGKVKDLRPGDYRPRGMTPLNDAVLDTIGAMDAKIGEGERAMVIILTDGLENASEASAETVKKAVRRAEKQGWSFLFIGANQHAETSASAIGLTKKGQALNFNASKVGTQSAMRTASLYAGQTVSSSSPEEYARTAAAMYDASGGVIPEEDDES